MVTPIIAFFRDIAALAKPGLTMMNVMMTAGAMGLANTKLSAMTWLMVLVSAALLVGSANAMNMYMEREGDKDMARTRRRPIPSGRMRASTALLLGLTGGVLSVVGLTVWGNIATGALGAFGFISYVWIYTPMKRRSPWAMQIGAIPGAIPPLLGWTAATGGFQIAGIVLFLIVFFWQIPHFIAIAIYRQSDYERAGIKTWPSVRGMDSAKNQALLYTFFLTPISLMLVPLGIASYAYLVAAGVLGLWFLITCVRGFEPESGQRWARHFFVVSIIYLPLLTLALIIDVVLIRGRGIV